MYWPEKKKKGLIHKPFDSLRDGDGDDVNTSFSETHSSNWSGKQSLHDILSWLDYPVIIFGDTEWWVIFVNLISAILLWDLFDLHYKVSEFHLHFYVYK